ncbi:hypothetical protein LguiA_005483 [Lonicera macranthoides]
MDSQSASCSTHSPSCPISSPDTNIPPPPPPPPPPTNPTTENNSDDEEDMEFDNATEVRIEQIGVKDSESQVQLPPPPAQVQVTPPLIQAQVPPPAPRPNIPRPRGGARRGSRMTRGRGRN